jgi:hypothetical protein
VPGTQFESSQFHHAFGRLWRFPVVVEKGPELAGLLYDRLVSETADLWFGDELALFISGLEIRFPGNGDRSWQRLGSNGRAIAPEAQASGAGGTIRQAGR